MTWDELLDLLADALEEAPDFAHSEQELADILLSAEVEDGLVAFDAAAEPGLRAAVRMYAREREWPELTEEEETCLRYRLSIAADYVAFLADASKVDGLGVGQPEMEEEDLIEWAVCVSWERNGYALMKDLIESYARGEYNEADAAELEDDEETPDDEEEEGGKR
jgi:hypothetical protein